MRTSKKNIELTMKQLQYSANAHGLCHNVFKHLSSPQENTQNGDALGNAAHRILPSLGGLERTHS